MSSIIEVLIQASTNMSVVALGAALAYFFGIKKLLRERELSRLESTRARTIDLYRQLVQDMAIIPELGSYNEEEKEALRLKLNRHVIELFQFAPDEIYREYTVVLRGIRRGASAKLLFDFMVRLRKELIPDTTLKVDEIIEIEKIV